VPICRDEKRAISVFKNAKKRCFIWQTGQQSGGEIIFYFCTHGLQGAWKGALGDKKGASGMRRRN
jgi:hypothetical protein